MSEKNWPEPFGYFCDWGDAEYGLQRIAMYYGEPGSAGENDWNEFPKVHENLPLYTAAQVRKIVAAEVAVEREACAKIGDRINAGTWAIEEYQDRIRERGSP